MCSGLVKPLECSVPMSFMSNQFGNTVGAATGLSTNGELRTVNGERRTVNDLLIVPIMRVMPVMPSIIAVVVVMMIIVRVIIIPAMIVIISLIGIVVPTVVVGAASETNAETICLRIALANRQQSYHPQHHKKKSFHFCTSLIIRRSNRCTYSSPLHQWPAIGRKALGRVASPRRPRVCGQRLVGSDLRADRRRARLYSNTDSIGRYVERPCSASHAALKSFD
jgi:hypothetical protein